MEDFMKVSVIGVGYVGLVTATCLANLGNKVIGIDIDKKKIDNLKKGIIPIYEPGLEDMVKKNYQAKRINFTTNFNKSVQKSDIVFIAVGTPPQEDGSADLQYVLTAAKQIAKAMKKYTIVINKSTVPIGTGKMVENEIKKYYKDDFDVVSNPEFLREGSAVSDFLNPDRVVIGHASKKSKEMLNKLYKPLNTTILFTNIKTAEMIKYASNSMLATQISFINSIANICKKVGANVEDVSRGMKLDKRIGKYSFLSAGAGYGGSCFPKDVKALVQIARKNDYHFKILEEVENVNKLQRVAIANEVLKMLKKPKGKKVAIWGLAFKPNTDDMREAPSIDIIQALQNQGVKIQAFDPVAQDNARTMLKNIKYFHNSKEVLIGCDLLLVMTDWDEFKQIDIKIIKKKLKKPVIFDARNIWDPEEMKKEKIIYQSIGR
jgi:UDPglucose 6-dehydrogenase